MPGIDGDVRCAADVLCFPRVFLKYYSIWGIAGGGCAGDAVDTRGDRRSGDPSVPYSTGRTPGETPRGDRRGGTGSGGGGVAGRSGIIDSSDMDACGDVWWSPATESSDMFATSVLTSSSESD